jgi:hypothetical protein
MTLKADVRIGTFEGDIRDLLRRYPADFRPYGTGLEHAQKYMTTLFDGLEPYIIMVSNAEMPRGHTTLSVIGPSRRKARKIMHDFTDRIELLTEEAPEYVYSIFEGVLRVIEQRYG